MSAVPDPPTIDEIIAQLQALSEEQRKQPLYFQLWDIRPSAVRWVTMDCVDGSTSYGRQGIVLTG